jgi:hypothetical protein
MTAEVVVARSTGDGANFGEARYSNAVASVSHGDLDPAEWDGAGMTIAHSP